MLIGLSAIGIPRTYIKLRGQRQHHRDVDFLFDKKFDDNGKMTNDDFMDGKCPEQYYNDCIVGKQTESNSQNQTLSGYETQKCTAEYLAYAIIFYARRNPTILGAMLSDDCQEYKTVDELLCASERHWKKEKTAKHLYEEVNGTRFLVGVAWWTLTNWVIRVIRKNRQLIHKMHEVAQAHLAYSSELKSRAKDFAYEFLMKKPTTQAKIDAINVKTNTFNIELAGLTNTLASIENGTINDDNGLKETTESRWKQLTHYNMIFNHLRELVSMTNEQLKDYKWIDIINKVVPPANEQLPNRFEKEPFCDPFLMRRFTLSKPQTMTIRAGGWTNSDPYSMIYKRYLDKYPNDPTRVSREYDEFMTSLMNKEDKRKKNSKNQNKRKRTSFENDLFGKNNHNNNGNNRNNDENGDNSSENSGDINITDKLKFIPMPRMSHLPFSILSNNNNSGMGLPLLDNDMVSDVHVSSALNGNNNNNNSNDNSNNNNSNNNNNHNGNENDRNSDGNHVDNNGNGNDDVQLIVKPDNTTQEQKDAYFAQWANKRGRRDRVNNATTHKGSICIELSDGDSTDNGNENEQKINVNVPSPQKQVGREKCIKAGGCHFYPLKYKLSHICVNCDTIEPCYMATHDACGHCGRRLRKIDDSKGKILLSNDNNNNNNDNGVNNINSNANERNSNENNKNNNENGMILGSNRVLQSQLLNSVRMHDQGTEGDDEDTDVDMDLASQQQQSQVNENSADSNKSNDNSRGKSSSGGRGGGGGGNGPSDDDSDSDNNDSRGGGGAGGNGGRGNGSGNGDAIDKSIELNRKVSDAPQ